MTDPADTRLGAYGTLRPGQVNHHLLDGLSGTWTPGTLRGRIVPVTSGPHTGLLGLVLDAEGDEVPVGVFASPDLPACWARLDAFEGAFFRRVTVPVATAEGEIPASVYVFTG